METENTNNAQQTNNNVIEEIVEVVKGLLFPEDEAERLAEFERAASAESRRSEEERQRADKGSRHRWPFEMVEDPQKEYPMAHGREIEELEQRQADCMELSKMLCSSLSGRGVDPNKRALFDTFDHGRREATSNPCTESHWNSIKIQGHVKLLKPIRVECEPAQHVHIRQCHGASHKKVLIELKHVAKSFLIEHCSNISIKVDHVISASRVLACENISIVVGGEVPAMYMRGVHSCEVTLCPDSMRGAVSTVDCSRVSVHAVPVSGILTLSAEDLVKAPMIYTAALPSRIRTHSVGGNLISEVRGMSDVPNAGELYWEKSGRAKVVEKPVEKFVV